jgi:hypothetical protein
MDKTIDNYNIGRCVFVFILIGHGFLYKENKTQVGKIEAVFKVF